MLFPYTYEELVDHLPEVKERILSTTDACEKSVARTLLLRLDYEHGNTLAAFCDIKDKLSNNSTIA